MWQRHTVRTNCMPPNQGATHNPQQTCRRRRRRRWWWWSTVGPSWSLAIIASCNDCKHNLAMLICVCCVSTLKSQLSSPVPSSSVGARRKSFPQNFPQVFLLLPPPPSPLWSWLGRLHRISTIIAASAANKPANKAKTTQQQQLATATTTTTMRQSIIIIIMRISRVARLKAAAKGGGAESGIHSNEFAILRNQIAQIFLSPSYAMQQAGKRAGTGETGEGEGRSPSCHCPDGAQLSN